MPHAIFTAFPYPSQPFGADHFAPRCVQCMNSGVLRCSVCKTEFYCSTECQTSHWHAHKSVCVHSKRYFSAFDSSLLSAEKIGADTTDETAGTVEGVFSYLYRAPKALADYLKQRLVEGGDLMGEGGADVATAITTFVSLFEREALNRRLSNSTRVAVDLLQAVATLLSTVISGIGTLSLRVASAYNALERYLSSMIDYLGRVMTGFVATLTSVSGLVWQFCVHVAEALVDVVEMLQDVGCQVVQTIVGGVVEVFSALSADIKLIRSNPSQSFIMEHACSILFMATELPSLVATGIQAGKELAVAQMKDIIGQITWVYSWVLDNVAVPVVSKLFQLIDKVIEKSRLAKLYARGQALKQRVYFNMVNYLKELLSKYAPRLCCALSLSSDITQTLTEFAMQKYTTLSGMLAQKAEGFTRMAEYERYQIQEAVRMYTFVQLQLAAFNKATPEALLGEYAHAQWRTAVEHMERLRVQLDAGKAKLAAALKADPLGFFRGKASNTWQLSRQRALAVLQHFDSTSDEERTLTKVPNKSMTDAADAIDYYRYGLNPSELRTADESAVQVIVHTMSALVALSRSVDKELQFRADYYRKNPDVYAAHLLAERKEADRAEAAEKPQNPVVKFVPSPDDVQTNIEGTHSKIGGLFDDDDEDERPRQRRGGDGGGDTASTTTTSPLLATSAYPNAGVQYTEIFRSEVPVAPVIVEGALDSMGTNMFLKQFRDRLSELIKNSTQKVSVGFWQMRVLSVNDLPKSQAELDLPPESRARYAPQMNEFLALRRKLEQDVTWIARIGALAYLMPYLTVLSAGILGVLLWTRHKYQDYATETVREAFKDNIISANVQTAASAGALKKVIGIESGRTALQKILTKIAPSAIILKNSTAKQREERLRAIPEESPEFTAAQEAASQPFKADGTRLTEEELYKSMYEAAELSAQRSAALRANAIRADFTAYTNTRANIDEANSIQSQLSGGEFSAEPNLAAMRNYVVDCAKTGQFNKVAELADALKIDMNGAAIGNHFSPEGHLYARSVSVVTTGKAGAALTEYRTNPSVIAAFTPTRLKLASALATASLATTTEVKKRIEDAFTKEETDYKTAEASYQAKVDEANRLIAESKTIVARARRWIYGEPQPKALPDSTYVEGRLPKPLNEKGVFQTTESGSARIDPKQGAKIAVDGGASQQYLDSQDGLVWLDQVSTVIQMGRVDNSMALTVAHNALAEVEKRNQTAAETIEMKKIQTEVLTLIEDAAEAREKFLTMQTQQLISSNIADKFLTGVFGAGQTQYFARKLAEFLLYLFGHTPKVYDAYNLLFPIPAQLIENAQDAVAKLDLLRKETTPVGAAEPFVKTFFAFAFNQFEYIKNLLRWAVSWVGFLRSFLTATKNYVGTTFQNVLLGSSVLIFVHHVAVYSASLIIGAYMSWKTRNMSPDTDVLIVDSRVKEWLNVTLRSMASKNGTTFLLSILTMMHPFIGGVASVLYHMYSLGFGMPLLRWFGTAMSLFTSIRFDVRSPQ